MIENLSLFCVLVPSVLLFENVYQLQHILEVQASEPLWMRRTAIYESHEALLSQIEPNCLWFWQAFNNPFAFVFFSSSIPLFGFIAVSSIHVCKLSSRLALTRTLLLTHFLSLLSLPSHSPRRSLCSRMSSSKAFQQACLRRKRNRERQRSFYLFITFVYSSS